MNILHLRASEASRTLYVKKKSSCRNNVVKAEEQKSVMLLVNSSGI